MAEMQQHVPSPVEGAGPSDEAGQSAVEREEQWAKEFDPAELELFFQGRLVYVFVDVCLAGVSGGKDNAYVAYQMTRVPQQQTPWPWRTIWPWPPPSARRAFLPCPPRMCTWHSSWELSRWLKRDHTANDTINPHARHYRAFSTQTKTRTKTMTPPR